VCCGGAAGDDSVFAALELPFGGDVTPALAPLGITADQVRPFLALLGFWLGNGALSGSANRMYVQFNQAKHGDDAHFVQWAMAKCGLGDGDVSALDANAKGDVVIVIKKRSWVDWFAAEFGAAVGASAKRLPEWTFELPADLCRAIVCGMQLADGTAAPNKSINVSSVRLRDELVRLMLHAGYSATFSQRAAGAWSVFFNDAAEHAEPSLRDGGASKAVVREVAYDGRTWCVNMNDGFVVVRRALRERDGVVTQASRPLIVGNCLKDIKSLPQRLKLAKDIVAGLNWMHANNIIHRDLKLANLLVTEDLQIKITDFGLSLHWYEGIVCHHFKGNVKYSSPEILRARADKNITIYAYCVRASDHQLLTNRGYMFLEDVEAHVQFDSSGRVADWRGLQVASFDPATDALVYQTPRGLVRNERSGSFVEFTAAGAAALWDRDDVNASAASDKTSHVSVVVTPDHEMYAAVGDTKDAAFRKLKASALADVNDVVRFRTTALAGGRALGVGRFPAPQAGAADDVDQLVAAANATNVRDVWDTLLPSVEACGGVDYAIVDSCRDVALRALPFAALGISTSVQATAFLELYGFWLGDGMLGNKTVKFGDVKARDLRFLMLRLRALELDSRTTVFRQTNGQVVVCVSAPAYVEQFVDAASNVARLMSWVWSLPAASLRALIRGIHLADGDKSSQLVYTSSVHMRDDLVRLCELAGYSATFTRAVANHASWSVLYSDDLRSRRTAPTLTIGATHDDRYEHLNVRRVAEDGRSWCFDMNNGFIVARRVKSVEAAADGVCGRVVTCASQPIVLGNCPQTDVYSFGLMLWELVTVMPLFPGVKGKQNITQHVLAGNRPEIYEEWPKSLKTLLALCWHEDPNRRPLFREIQDKFDRVIIDVMCFGRDTPLLMADGSFKAVQDVVVGDWLLGDDGRTARQVTRTTRGVDQMARVELRGELDGERTRDGFVCNMSHLLSCKLESYASFRVLRNGTARLSLAVADSTPAVDADSDNQITRLHYVERDVVSWRFAHTTVVALGGAVAVGGDAAQPFATLGDAVRTVDAQFGLRLSEADIEAICERSSVGGGVRLSFDAAQIAAVQSAVRESLALELTPLYDDETVDIAVRHVLDEKRVSAAARRALLAYHAPAATFVGGKEPRELPTEPYVVGFSLAGIPDEYRRGSIETRRQLLAGILDAVGSSPDGSVFDVALTSEALLRDCEFVARSLGLVVSRHESVKLGKRAADAPALLAESLSCRIAGDTAQLPTRVVQVRKDAVGGRAAGRQPIDVRAVAAAEFFGVTVGGNGRVIVADALIVSHNCPDPTGRRICKKLWKGCELKKVTYEEFEEAFLEKTRLNLKLIRHIHLKCLCAVICDNFDDTITLERFCNAVNWFGPMYPVEKFLERIRDLLQKKWFHGFVNSNKAAQLLKTRWSSTKQQYYLYRFSLSTPGCFALTFIEEDGTIVHKRISHSFNSSFVLMNNSPALDFLSIDQLHNGCLQDPNLLRAKKILPGSPFSSLFE
jgi:serine/threonine protein kinase